MAATDGISPSEFHASDGVEDWRVLLQRACTVFRTGDFSTGVEFVRAIGALADAADHHPDVDLRYSAVTVRLSSHDVGGLSRRDVALAQRISTAALALGVEADPRAAQLIEIAIDVMDGSAVEPFWRAILGLRAGDLDSETGAHELSDALGALPAVWFQQMDEPRVQRNRIHIDVSVAHDEANQRIERALTAGGVLFSDVEAPAFWVLRDVEGNEACISTWQGRE